MPSTDTLPADTPLPTLLARRHTQASPTPADPPPFNPTATASPVPPTPGPTATPTPLACLQSGGRIETGSHRSLKLKLPMEWRVYLPPCYDELPDRRYPVLYMIHGMNFNEDQWDRMGIDETAGRLIAAGELPPFIIVMPRDRNWDQPQNDPFGEVVIEELIPWVDATYRTQPERAGRAVGGLSRGGGWAVHFGLGHWQMFSAIGAHSVAVFWSDTSKIRGWLDGIPPADLPRIYLDIGEQDRDEILNSAIWFEGVLAEKHIPHEWHFNQGYHDEAYWSSHIEDYLRWYAAGW